MVFPTGVHEIRSLESLQYDLKTITAATDNFSEDNILGRGGFGSVYKVIYEGFIFIRTFVAF